MTIQELADETKSMRQNEKIRRRTDTAADRGGCQHTMAQGSGFQDYCTHCLTLYSHGDALEIPPDIGYPGHTTSSCTPTSLISKMRWWLGMGSRCTTLHMRPIRAPVVQQSEMIFPKLLATRAHKRVLIMSKKRRVIGSHDCRGMVHASSQIQPAINYDIVAPSSVGCQAELPPRTFCTFRRELSSHRLVMLPIVPEEFGAA